MDGQYVDAGHVWKCQTVAEVSEVADHLLARGLHHVHMTIAVTTVVIVAIMRAIVHEGVVAGSFII